MPIRKSTTAKTHSPDGSLTTSEMDRRYTVFIDQSVIETTCALCQTVIHNGPAIDGRAAFLSHIQTEHPDWRPVSRSQKARQAHARAVRLAAERRA